MRYRRDLEIIGHLRSQALTLGAPTVLGKDFPLGEGWYNVFLRFNLVVVIGTGAGPVAEGELLIIKNIVLRTSAGEILVNLPGRALFKIANALWGTIPRKDAIAAASATYRVDLPIAFVDDRMKRPEDTILDTGRYSAMALEITMGGLTDLFTAPGTATLTASLDMEIERTKGKLPKKALPVFHRFYGSNPSQDAAVQTFIDIDRAPDVAYKRFFAHASATGVAGGVFTGANADDVQDFESIVDQSGDIVRERIHEMIQNQNKRDYSLETVLAGITIFDLVRDGSINSALYPGDRSRLQYKWVNKAGVAANDVVSLAHDAVRGLKG
jgi:Ca2+-binding EF-hand superfamily protein